jgi:hypothetical protein
MDENRIMRPFRPDERAANREVHNYQGPGVVDSAGVRRRRSILPREVCAVSLSRGLRLSQGDLNCNTEVSRRRSKRGDPLKA